MAFKLFYNIFAVISAFSVLIPIRTALINKKYLKGGRIFMVLLFYLILSLFTELVNTLFVLLKVQTTMVGNTFYLFEFLLITELFYYSIPDRKKIKKFIFISRIVCLLIFSLGLFSGWMGIFKGTTGCIIMILSILMFYNLLLKHEYDTELNLMENSTFLLNCSIMIYFSSTFFVFLFEPLITAPNTSARIIWTVPLLFNVIFYLMIKKTICKMKII